ncbi:MAG: xanthine phosphoribosyltransferase [Clostridia bacterium]|nr:xanthine phosphoribosyltransferase [Clostridia bacterium]
MKELVDRIIKDGTTRAGTDIVKVDNFLNHQVDPFLMRDIALEFKKIFAEEKITKILTIEASGIAIASFAAMEFGVPFVFAKKHNARNLDDDVYSAEVYSFTKMTSYVIRVAKNYLSADDRVLIVDDFLANGKALEGLLSIVKEAGAEVAGCGVVIEKAYQKGGDRIRSLGYRVEPLAKIKEITEEGQIVFD